MGKGEEERIRRVERRESSLVVEEGRLKGAKEFRVYLHAERVHREGRRKSKSDKRERSKWVRRESKSEVIRGKCLG